MAAERYLNHPTFGMLYRVAPAGEGRDVYATLYAQRMFFQTLQPRGAQFEVIPSGCAASRGCAPKSLSPRWVAGSGGLAATVRSDLI